MDLYFSNADRWMRCGASISRLERVTQWDNSAALEGTAAHWMAERILFGDAHSVDDFEGEICPRTGVEIDDEMRVAVKHYVDDIRDMAQDYELTGTEHSASIFGVRGRVDFYGQSRDRVFIADFKYGYRPPSADTWQNIIGALAIAHDPFVYATLAVCAPRARPGSPWDFVHLTPADMVKYRRQVHERVTELEMNDRSPHAGSWCHYCKFAAACQTLEQRIEQLSESMDLQELFELQKLIKTRITAISTDMENRLKQGEHVPGYWLEPYTSKRQWLVDPATVEVTTGHRAYKSVLKSPNELEKEGVNRKLLDTLTHKPEVGRRLAQLDQKAVKRMFGD